MAGNEVLKTLNDQQSYILSKAYKIETFQLKVNYPMSSKKSQAILKCLLQLTSTVSLKTMEPHMGTSEIRGLQLCRCTESNVWFTLRSEGETMCCDTYCFFQLDYQSRFSKH